ncbi:MAG: hypothetical protein M3P40_00955 [Actinomycetota bacterium]|nr:hypothetical protein [Actinomycetota bacterium]
MSGSPNAAPAGHSASDRSPEEVLTEPAKVPPHGWRARMRARPSFRPVYRVCVFLVGLTFIILGLALAVLPGPLTIPPVLLGLWIWSREFRFAQRIFESFLERAKETWAHAKRHPISSTIVTVGGLAGAVAIGWAMAHYQLIDQARELVGI